MLHAYVLCRNHLTVEEHILSAILLIDTLHDRENTLYKLLILIIRSYLKSHKLSCFHESINTNSKILATHIDITSIKEWEHAMSLKVFQIFIVSQLHLMTEVDDVCKILLVILAIVYCILDTTVDIDCQH